MKEGKAILFYENHIGTMDNCYYTYSKKKNKFRNLTMVHLDESFVYNDLN